MNTLILTGPAGAGKTSIARETAKHFPRLVVLEVDELRQMVAAGYQTPWSSEEGHRQHLIAIMNACVMARNYQEADYPVIIVDTLTDGTYPIYEQALNLTQVVLVIPTFEEIRKRYRGGGISLTPEEVEMLFLSQSNLKVPAMRIENTHLSIEQCAEILSGVLRSIL